MTLKKIVRKTFNALFIVMIMPFVLLCLPGLIPGFIYSWSVDFDDKYYTQTVIISLMFEFAFFGLCLIISYLHLGRQ